MGQELSPGLSAAVALEVSEPDTAVYYNNSRITDTVRNRANVKQKATWARKKAGMARAMSQVGGTE